MKAKLFTFVRGLKNGTPPRFQSYLKSLVLLVAVVASVNGWGAGTVVTYTVNSTSSVTKSGTAPTGATATYTQDYTTKSQLTEAKPNARLTLSGYEGNKITAISLNMKNSNSKKATVNVSVGSTKVVDNASISLSTTATDKSLTLSGKPGIKDGEDVVISITASGSSVYIYSFKITYEQAAKTTVTWYAAGGEYESGEQIVGAAITFPENPNPEEYSCSGKSFYGWTTDANYSNETTPPTILTANDKVKESGNNYYAVFADEVGYSNEYVKGTTSDLRGGSKLIVVNSTNKAMSNSASGTKLSPVTVTVSSNKITNPDASVVWEVSVSDGKYIFKNGGKYLRATANNNLALSTTSDSWTIGTSNSKYTFTSANCSKQLEYYNNLFTVYNTGTDAAYLMDLYINNISYSQYSTSCVAAAVEKPTITTTATKEQDVYWGTVPVTLACETSGAEIYYTTDGNEPTKASTKYNGPFNITATTTIKAKAFVGSDESYTATQTFTVGRMYADANAYLADKTNIADGEKVKITNLRVAITSFSGNRNDVYFAENTNFHVGSAAPNTWAVNGILTAEDKIFTAKVFSGPSYQLRPSSWGDLTYVTLSSITVKNAETTYTDGDKFNPTGLVITKTYSDNTTEDFAYEGNEGAFSFSPSLTTNLRPTNTSVTITVQGKSCILDITVNPIPVTGVTLDKTSAALFVGQTLQLNATVAPDNATTKMVSWSSSSDAATVSNNGLVTAAKAGSATITVTTTDQNKTATCAVNAYSVTINKVGDESKASNIATFNPANSQVVIGKATHFQFVSINVEGATCTGSASPYTLSNPTDNVVVTVTWKEDSKVTVTFSDAIHDNNSDYMEYVGDKIQFPTITDAAKGDGCEGEHYHFVGWTKDASQPNALVTPASETAPATDITYYAVWAKEL